MNPNCPNGFYCFKVNVFNIIVVIIIIAILYIYYHCYSSLELKINSRSSIDNSVTRNLDKISSSLDKLSEKEDMKNYALGENRPHIYIVPDRQPTTEPQAYPPSIVKNIPPSISDVNNLYLNTSYTEPQINPDYNGYSPDVPINIPTRGEPGAYQQVGFLINNKSDESMPLYGRQTYPSSRKWNYYTNNLDNVKQPLIVNNKNCMDYGGCDEVYGGENINLQGTKKKYKVEKYNYSQPRYLPF